MISYSLARTVGRKKKRGSASSWNFKAGSSLPACCSPVEREKEEGGGYQVEGLGEFRAKKSPPFSAKLLCVVLIFPRKWKKRSKKKGKGEGGRVSFSASLSLSLSLLSHEASFSPPSSPQGRN